MPKLSAVDFVLERAAVAMNNPPKRSWFSKLPPEAQQRLREVKRAYTDGKFAGVSYATLCKAITDLLREYKWPVPTNQDTILRWLRSSGT
jgi:hypothetical protein